MQIRVFVNQRTTWLTQLTTELHTQLGSMMAALPVVAAARSPTSLPDVAVYFGNTFAPTPGEKDEIRDYIANGVSVIPLLQRPQDAPAQLPADVPELGRLNAVFVEPPDDPDHLRMGAYNWPAILVDAILSHAWATRTDRKVFISYRRTDAAGVAHQLWEALSSQKMSVFRDAVAIQYADDFQRSLKWQLNDSDMLILLASPQLSESAWVLEEIGFANMASIGVLAVRWPEATFEDPRGTLSAAQVAQESNAIAETTQDQQLWLGANALVRTGAGPDTDILSSEELDRVVEAVHRFRAQAVARRLKDLVPYAQQQFSSQGLDVALAARLGDLEVASKGGVTPAKVVRVVPYRPTVDTLYSLYKELEARPNIGEIGCYYAENDPTSTSARALTWAVEATRAGAPPNGHHVWAYTGHTGVRRGSP